MLSSIDSVIERTPRWRPEWREILLRMREHPDAPRWNTQVGDRISAEDEAFVRRFEENLSRDRKRKARAVPAALVEWIMKLKGRSAWFSMALEGIDPAREFSRIRTMTRADLQLRLEEIIPTDEPLDRLIINPTSGTTGQPIQAPNHPRAIGCYDTLIQYCLRRHGVDQRYDHNVVAAIQACFQKQTIVYNTVHSLLDGAGFAKVNLDKDAWPGEGSADRYIADMAPVFISGDPIAFEELMRLGITYKPKAFLSCALALPTGLRDSLVSRYGCPVVDFYSLNETGPIAYSRPDDPSVFQVLPNDVYVEILDAEGNRLPDGRAGEICVTGGRNPFLPLLRYRTGDRGIMHHDHGHEDDPAPLLRLVDARKPVLFRRPSGGLVNPIDICRILRKYQVRRHRCVQGKGLSLLLEIECASFALSKNALIKEVGDLFGGEVDIRLDMLDSRGKVELGSFDVEW